MQMLTTRESLHFSGRLPIIVEMINGLRIGANEGGQQPSDGLYLVNSKTPCVRMQTSVKTSRFCGQLSRQIQGVETTLSYRKQRTVNCSNSQKIKKWESLFSALIPALFCAPAGAFGATKTRQHPAAAQPDRVHSGALPQTDIQNICGTITIWGTVRSHGISTII
jgi:hypothetical protein